MSSDESETVSDPHKLWIPDAKESAIRQGIAATIILERRMISRSFWSVPSWYLHTIGVGDNLAATQGVQVREGASAGKSDKGDLFVWSGFEVVLFKDACERYWHALIGDKPLIYVICRDDSDEADEADDGSGDHRAMTPMAVTIDYDEASAAAETDSPVLSAPIPGELYRLMERFVLTHYKPQEFKKRKRRNWSAAEDSQQKNEGAGKRRPGHESRP